MATTVKDADANMGTCSTCWGRVDPGYGCRDEKGRQFCQEECLWVARRTDRNLSALAHLGRTTW